MPYAIAFVVALFLLVAAGIEVKDLVHEYPGQFLTGTFTVLFFAVASGAILLRRAAQGGRPVPLARELPPLPKAIQAVPVLTAIATAGPHEDLDCERGECGRKTTPKAAWGVQVAGEAAEHLFCSQWCAQAWDYARSQPLQLTAHANAGLAAAPLTQPGSPPAAHPPRWLPRPRWRCCS